VQPPQAGPERSSGSRLDVALTALAVLLLILFLFPALVFFGGPVGHCYENLECQADEAILSGLWGQKVVGFYGYPVAALVLTWASSRSRPAAVALAALSTMVVLAGLVPILAGFWETDPHILGFAVPLISPGYTFWIPAAIVMLIVAWRRA
jgi:hypothetical protein